MDPTKERERKEKNMLEDVSVESRLTSGVSGLPDSSENKWKLSSSLEAVKRYQNDGKGGLNEQVEVKAVFKVGLLRSRLMLRAG